MPAPLTVVIPTLNEASQIAECVRGLAWAGEVIVVDAGSEDGTAGAARAAGARVLDGAAPGIAARRNTKPTASSAAICSTATCCAAGIGVATGSCVCFAASVVSAAPPRTRDCKG